MARACNELEGQRRLESTIAGTHHLLDTLGSVRVLADRELLELVDESGPLGDESGEGGKVGLLRSGDLGDKSVELPDEVSAEDGESVLDELWREGENQRSL
jgi:hypothetical protein